MKVIKTDNGLVKAWVDGVELGDKALGQIINVANMPFIHKHVAVMPDAHWGMGCTVGSVLATKGAIIPASVGVDIGCGMVAAMTNLTADMLPDNLHNLRVSIEANVPHGGPGVKGSWNERGYRMPPRVESAWLAKLSYGWSMLNTDPLIKVGGVTIEQLGTLGGGNHFIEICLDESNRVWVMLHSGSRGPGNRIGQFFIEKAKIDMRRYYINLPDVDLAYIPDNTPEFGMYWTALSWAQQFAQVNRDMMLASVWHALRLYWPDIEYMEGAINCHHNYVAKEHHYGENVWVTRKGAVRAQLGDMGIIPGSMGAKSFIVRGKGNPESFNSCSHGAGRVMSRGQARKQISMEQHRQAVAGVECRVDEDVIDESPAAYKDVEKVMAAQADLVEIVHTLKQVLCVKG